MNSRSSGFDTASSITVIIAGVFAAFTVAFLFAILIINIYAMFFADLPIFNVFRSVDSPILSSLILM